MAYFLDIRYYDIMLQMMKKLEKGMQMKIYLTRHGQTEWNVIGKLQGWGNSNLTEKGIENAKRLSQRLKEVNFDYVYSSPQQRALDTAKLIRGDRNIEINVLDDLREIGFGSWEGMEIK